MSEPREFWLNVFPLEHKNICHIYAWDDENSSKNAGYEDAPPEIIHVREVVTMPSEDEIASLSYEYDIPTHRNCMGCCQSDSDYEQAWQAGFKKALEFMGYKKGSSE